MKKTLLAISTLLAVGLNASAQVNYFVDGYHGGVYGHYPLYTYTQFMVDQLRQNPDWRIGLEIEPETWDSVKVATPAAYEAFRQAMQTPQVEVTNPTYGQPYLFNISGESIIRQFQYGMKKLWQHFPGITFTTYATEEPCFTSQLPQLLRMMGFKYMVLKNPDTCWGGYTEAKGGESVWLVGPDGTRMLAVPRYACEDFVPGSVWQTSAWSNNQAFLSACKDAGIANPAGMCYQDAGWTGGPWIKDLGNTRFTRWTDYFRNVIDTTKSTVWHFSQDDIQVDLMWGSQVLQQIAQRVRRAENRIIQAEKLAAMSHVLKGAQPDRQKLDEAWRNLLLAQHHDAWIVPYNNLQKTTWAGAVKAWTDKTLALSDSIMAEAVGGDGPLCVYNTTGHERSEVISLGNGSYAEVTVPAMSYVECPAPQSSKSSTFSGDYEIAFDLRHGGVISSLKDKRRKGRQVAGSGFGELRGFFPGLGRFVSSTEHPATMRVLTENSLVKVISVEGQIAGVPYTFVYTLRKGSRLIDVDLVIDWKENVPIGERFARGTDYRRKPYYDTHYMLSLCFPPAFKAERLFKDAPFDICESRHKDTRFNRWDSIKNNVALSWVDVCDKKASEGLAVFTDQTTSFTHSPETPLAVTVQYSGPGLFNRNYTHNTQTHLRFALLPHDGDPYKADIATESSCWKEPLLMLPAMRGDKGGSVGLPRLPKGCQLSALLVDGDTTKMRLYHAEDHHRLEEKVLVGK